MEKPLPKSPVDILISLTPEERQMLNEKFEGLVVEIYPNGETGFARQAGKQRTNKQPNSLPEKGKVKNI